LHPLVPVHDPPHRRKVDPLSGFGTKVTFVPRGNVAEHEPGQAIPAGWLETEPAPTTTATRVALGAAATGVATPSNETAATAMASFPIALPLQRRNILAHCLSLLRWDRVHKLSLNSTSWRWDIARKPAPLQVDRHGTGRGKGVVFGRRASLVLHHDVHPSSWSISGRASLV
jgi:hypothetical protein